MRARANLGAGVRSPASAAATSSSLLTSVASALREPPLVVDDAVVQTVAYQVEPLCVGLGRR